jgi:prepilin-type N-terminal cleavage/methylation domain-containing protein
MIARQHPLARSLGFTLIELLVVIAIIALLVAILVPALASARALAQRTVCGAHMKSIGTGLNMYVGDYQDVMPPRSCKLQEGGVSWSWYFFDFFIPLVDGAARPAKGWQVTVANQPEPGTAYNRIVHTNQMGDQPFGNSWMMNCPGQLRQPSSYDATGLPGRQHYAENIRYDWTFDGTTMGGPKHPLKFAQVKDPQRFCQVYEPQAWSSPGTNEYMDWDQPVINLISRLPHLKSGASLFLDGHSQVLDANSLMPFLEAVTLNQANPTVTWPFKTTLLP